MAKIQELDRKTMKLVSDRILAALEPVGKELGIAFTNKGGKFSPEYGTFKIEGAIIENGTAKTSAVVDFENYASEFGLKASDLGKTFVFRGDTYRIVGLAIKRTKRPIIAEKIGALSGAAVSSQRFVFEAEVVAAALGYKVKKGLRGSAFGGPNI